MVNETQSDNTGRGEGECKKQHFEVRCSFNPYQEGMREWSGIFGIILHYLYIFLYPGHREQTYPDHRYIDHSGTHPEHLYSK